MARIASQQRRARRLPLLGPDARAARPRRSTSSVLEGALSLTEPYPVRDVGECCTRTLGWLHLRGGRCATAQGERQRERRHPILDLRVVGVVSRALWPGGCTRRIRRLKIPIARGALAS